MTTITEPSTRLHHLIKQYDVVRSFSEELCEPLQIEDYVIQSMPDASPTRWHLAHTTWFFETFLLKPYVPGYKSMNGQFEYLFNSYYNAVGRPFPRPERGHLSRPTVAEVMEYRRDVDVHVHSLVNSLRNDEADALCEVMELGLNHEQQHQELILTDIKHALSRNPLFPSYLPTPSAEQRWEPSSLQWLPGRAGIVEVGDATRAFVFDNERPRHEVLLRPYRLGTRPVTCGEYLAFMDDGGYRRPGLWLSLGWQAVTEQSWEAPLYWHPQDGRWHQFTLHGLQPVELSEPVCHVSYFEADAFARWANCRLPTEAEWETSAQSLAIEGNFADDRWFHPRAAVASNGPQQFFGDVWEWTASPYAPYPGYRPATGALGEYNGKFMCNQFVLRGGSCATSQSHIRSTYRNFFPPEARWQFTGIRLAQDDA
jgi:ergothioneine biosynthesis protein EgtB